MIKRNDLTKQFELVVQQEITNHNNAVSASNAAVEAIKLKLVSIHDEHKKDSNRLENEILLLKSQLKESDASARAIKANLYTRCMTIERKAEKQSNRIDDVENKITSFEETLLAFNKDILSIKSIASSLGNECKHLLKVVKQDLDLHQHKYCNELMKMEKSILERPTEDLELRKELMDRLSETKVTVDGIKEHVDHISSKNAYNLKQIEDLRNILKRQTTDK